MTADIMHYVTCKERSRSKALKKCKTKDQEKNRLKRKFLALTNDEAKANKERAWRAGTYKSVVNMAVGLSIAAQRRKRRWAFCRLRNLRSNYITSMLIPTL
jgi:ribosomal protein S3AE